LDGYRAYAAVLSGYSVALIAIQQIDNPQHVFETGMARGAAVVVGILSIAVINTLTFAPDRQLSLIAQLEAIHHRVREFAHEAVRGRLENSTTFLTLLREIVAFRPETGSVVLESSSGAAKSVAARNAAVQHDSRPLTFRLYPILPHDLIPRTRLATIADTSTQRFP
jgi:uncharacterized membrane protein YccC